MKPNYMVDQAKMAFTRYVAALVMWDEVQAEDPLVRFQQLTRDEREGRKSPVAGPMKEVRSE